MLVAHEACAAPPDRTEAFRFLEQATFGPTQSDIDHLIALGESADAYSLWIDEQMAIAPSLLLPVVQARFASGITGAPGLNTGRQDAWLRTTVVGPDQLRQRVAFALVGDHGGLATRRAARRPRLRPASYYDVLTRNAFGNFRQLLEDVTLHPAMGTYLSMLGNQKPDAVAQHPTRRKLRARAHAAVLDRARAAERGRHACKTGESGQPIPTYDQSVVEGFANVFTGWNYCGCDLVLDGEAYERQRRSQPMKAYPEQHATGRSNC